MGQKLKGYGMDFRRKSKKITRFPNFQFCTIPKTENLEISESFI